MQQSGRAGGAQWDGNGSVSIKVSKWNIAVLHSGLEPQGEQELHTHTHIHAWTHTYTVRSMQSPLSQLLYCDLASERNGEKQTTDADYERVNSKARRLFRHTRVHRHVCALALTHSCSVHYTFTHMGNNEITKIILSEIRNPLHFHGWCPLHVNSMRRGGKPTLPPRALSFSPLAFLDAEIKPV